MGDFIAYILIKFDYKLMSQSVGGRERKNTAY